MLPALEVEASSLLKAPNPAAAKIKYFVIRP
jgi:hypothetical protein